LQPVDSVIVLTPWFPNYPGDRNGAFIYDSALALSRLGMDVTVFVCRPQIPSVLDKFAPEWTQGTVEASRFGGIARIVTCRYLSVPGGLLRPLTNLSQRYSVGYALRSLIKQVKPKLIHAQTEGMAPIALSIAERFNLPVVTTIHGINSDQHYLHARRQRALLAPALNRTTRLVLVGSPLFDFFKNYVGRSDHMRIVPNGVNLPAATREQPILSNTDRRLVSVSNLHEGKGIDITLDALALLESSGIRDWSYRVVGGGAEHASLAKRAAKLGLADKVHFLGALAPDMVFETLLNSDIFVLPSYREAFGIAYLEAMACGLVTIGAKSQGPEAFIDHSRTGYLVEPQSASALAECLGLIMSDPLSARRVGERAQAVAHSFDWESHARQLVRVYEEAIRA
jgi:glycosyltransferase involved in cell wall biosynthesis